MSKIRVLADHVANQIAAGEVVERPASVAKELVENSIDAGATRIAIEIEAGGRRLLKISDDGEGMVRDDAVLAFERHATSKIQDSDDLAAIGTLGFRGEALASIASVAKVELTTCIEGANAATRVVIEGGRMRDVKDAAHPRGTTITVRDLFFNVPARRKFLRSEATESFHLTNLVTHYALAHPEISFVLANNGRGTLRATPANDLRERAYQVFGSDFIDSLLEVGGAQPEGSHRANQLTRVSGYVSAPRERRTSRDAQFLFVNGRFVRDRLIGRAVSEGYRSILPHGVYPVALLFIDVPLEEVDVNVHPAKTEVRFRRAAAVADSVRAAVRAALASAGYAPAETQTSAEFRRDEVGSDADENRITPTDVAETEIPSRIEPSVRSTFTLRPEPQQERIGFGFATAVQTQLSAEEIAASPEIGLSEPLPADPMPVVKGISDEEVQPEVSPSLRPAPALPPLNSATKFVGEVTDSLSQNIRPLGQLDESFIIATDDEGLLLIDQHVAHERVLFDKYRALETARQAESQRMLIPETFDLTPAQATAFETIAEELESYGFELMRLSGRTVAIKATPADLPASEARNVLSEVLDSIDQSEEHTS